MEELGFYPKTPDMLDGTSHAPQSKLGFNSQNPCFHWLMENREGRGVVFSVAGAIQGRVWG